METFINKYGFITSENHHSDPKSLLTENARIEKWTLMLQDWRSYYYLRPSKVLKKRIRKGIPSSIRGAVWYKLAEVDGFRAKYDPGLYTRLVNSSGESPSLDIIERDLHRTFPSNIMFQSEEGIDRLLRLLKAYSLFDPQVGYTQGMSYVAALCLLLLPEEDAFWLFTTILNAYGMRKCFQDSMPRIKCCFYISSALLRHTFPKVHAHFNQINLCQSMYATQWFMTGFAVNFPIETVLRIWDCYLYEDQKIFFRAYLAIIKEQKHLLKQSSFEEAIKALKEASRIPAEDLMTRMFKIRLSRKTIDRLLKDYLNHPKTKYLD